MKPLSAHPSIPPLHPLPPAGRSGCCHPPISHPYLAHISPISCLHLAQAAATRAPSLVWATSLLRKQPVAAAFICEHTRLLLLTEPARLFGMRLPSAGSGPGAVGGGLLPVPREADAVGAAASVAPNCEACAGRCPPCTSHTSRCKREVGEMWARCERVSPSCEACAGSCPPALFFLPP